MKRARIYCPFFPYPFSEAAFQTMFNQAQALVRLGWSVEMVTWKSSIADAVRGLKKAPQDILQSGFEVRFLADNPKQTFTLPQLASRAEEEKTLKPDDRTGRVLAAFASGYASPELYYYPPELDLRSELGEVDLAIYHYSFSYAWLKKNLGLKGTLEKQQIVHFHNLECDVFRARAAEEKSIPTRLVHLLNAGRLDRHERELAKLMDEAWQHSPMDLHDYKMRTGFEKQRVVPPTMSRDQWDYRVSHFKSFASVPMAAARVGFVGGLDFEPNRSSAAWILREVAPRLLKARFAGELVFAGKGPPDGWLNQFPEYGFVRFLGFVPSLEDFWASLSYLLVPHISGGGVRLKLLEALGSQLPVIANQAAVRRLLPEVRMSALLFVSDDPEEWAERIASEKPFAKRLELIEEPFCAGIDGERLYGFLS